MYHIKYEIESYFASFLTWLDWQFGAQNGRIKFVAERLGAFASLLVLPAKNALRAPISAPTQPPFFVHPKFGITSKWDIHVEDPRPRGPADWVSVFEQVRAA
jgi:hypothetical protein